MSSQASISQEDIHEFAIEFDPQPYHLDVQAGDDSIFGGLCASGWHVTAVMMRLLSDSFRATGIELLSSKSVSKLTWRRPVFAADSLVSTLTIAEKSTSDDDRYGLVTCDIAVANQSGDAVIQLSTTVMVGHDPQGARNNG